MAAMFNSTIPETSPATPPPNSEAGTGRQELMLSVLDLHRPEAPAPQPAAETFQAPEIDPGTVVQLAAEHASWSSRALALAGDACAGSGRPAEAIDLYSRSLELKPEESLARRRDEILEFALRTGKFDLPHLFRTFSGWAARQDLDRGKLRLMSEFLNYIQCPGRALEYAVRSLQVSLAQPGPHPAEDYQQLEALEQRAGELARATRGLPHVLFYSLGNAGVSAIHPILKEILTEQFAYDQYGNPALSDLVKPFFDGPSPLLLWTHFSRDRFEEFLGRPDCKILILFRDPRDVTVSHMKQLYSDGYLDRAVPEKTALRAMIPNLAQWFAATTEWLSLPPSRRFAFSFEEMKQDVPAMARRILDFLELPVPDQIIRAKCDHWSYEAQAKRRRGEEGKPVRTVYLFRKGISGDWKNHFDEDLAQLFERHCGKYLKLWGYQP